MSDFVDVGVRKSGDVYVMVTVHGEPLTLVWSPDDAEPEIAGADALAANDALRASMVDVARTHYALNGGEDAIAHAEEAAAEQFDEIVHQGVVGLDAQPLSDDAVDELRPNPESAGQRRKRLQKLHDEAFKTLSGMVRLLNCPWDTTSPVLTWCSGCFTLAWHRQLKTPFGWALAWICQHCGQATTNCTMPNCAFKAVRGYDTYLAKGVVALCAEHDHQIPRFEEAPTRIADLTAWKDLFEFRRANVRAWAKGTTLVVASAAVTAGAAFGAASLIGGAIGSVGTGLSGAAATSHGLALLGGGTLAAGGMGMAGGTAVVVGSGGLLGAVTGVSLGSSYLADDKSFRIERVRDGEGPTVIVASGFLTEKEEAHDAWLEVIDRAYPTNPLYRVSWGAKELKALALLLGGGAAHGVSRAVVPSMLERVSKQAATKLGPLASTFLAADLIANPWHIAVNRAAGAGATLAATLVRTDLPEGCILVGHSLGGALMAHAVQALAGAEKNPVRDVHLLGAAITNRLDPYTLERGVSGHVYNYFSTRDKVLSGLYRAAQLGLIAAGSRGLAVTAGRVHNVDVSARVSGHGEYFSEATLRR